MSIRKALKRTLTSVAILSILLALFFIVENWRGKHEWNRVIQDTQAKGVSVDWATYIPEQIPDDLNLNKAPAIAYWEHQKSGTSTKQKIEWKELWGPLEDLNNLTSELRDKQEFYTERSSNLELVKKLEPYQNLLDELRKSCKERPLARLDGDYDGDPFSCAIPPFSVSRTYTTLLWADAIVQLNKNRAELALENTEAMRCLSNLSPQPYFLVNSMIETVVEKNLIIPIYVEGLRRNAFSDEQLKLIAGECLRGAPLEKLEKSFHAELAAGIRFGELCISKDLELEMLDLVDLDIGRLEFFTKLMPRGWQWIMFSRNTHYVSYQLDIYDRSKRRLETESIDKIHDTYDQVITEAKFFNLLAAMGLPAFEKIWDHTTLLQQTKDMCGIACAIELYRREHGLLPADLNGLEPKILPLVHNDPITGAPYYYERVNDKEFRLWSVGNDRTNDNGHNNKNEPKDNVWPLSTNKQKPREWNCEHSPVTANAQSSNELTNDETVSVDFIEEDVRIIIRNVADLYDLNLVIPNTFPESHKITIKLRDVTWPQLFDLLLEQMGYTWYKENNLIQIISLEDIADIYPDELAIVNKLNPDELSPLLESYMEDGWISEIGSCSNPKHIHFRAHISYSNELKELIETMDKTGYGLIPEN